MNWLEASAQLKNGDHVRFVTDWDLFPETIVPAGTTATVIENGLNEMEPVLIVRSNDHAVVYALREWDGDVFLYGPQSPDSLEWTEECPIEIIQS